MNDTEDDKEFAYMRDSILDEAKNAMSVEWATYCLTRAVVLCAHEIRELRKGKHE